MNALMRRLMGGARMVRVFSRTMRRTSALARPSTHGLYRATARLLCGTLILGTVPSPVLADITREVSLNPGWHLVSIPLMPAASSAEAVFASLPSPRRLYDYVAGQTLGLLDAGFRNIRAGWAYKVLAEAPVTLRVTGQAVSPTQPYSIPITPGWNAIGTPWLTALPWSDSRVSVRQTSTGTTQSLAAAVASGWVEAEARALNPSTDTYTVLVANAPGAEFTPWRGYEIFSTITGNLILEPPPVDPNPPFIGPIASPLDGSVVTEPTPIIGTIQDLELAEWRVEIGRPGAPASSYQVIGTGTGEVTNGTLATIDPTMLRNGLYTIRIVATDIFGRTATIESTVVVKERMKVGAFSVAFTDMEVPVAGLPIRVTRTYDTRDSATRGDWGNGWSLDISQARLQTSVTPGVGWNTSLSGGLIPTACVNPSRAHVVTVTLPDETVLEFDASLTPSCQAFTISATTMIFTPRPGTLATIQAIGGADLLVVATGWPGTAELTTFSGTTFDPTTYLVRMRDGREFTIHKTLGLQTIKDLNGNQLTYNSAGITHSSGKGIAIGRDGTGRILSITDPMGESLTYAYNPQGDLETVTDREGNVTTMTYLADPAHFLDEIRDPLGRTPIRNTYYPDGRIRSHTDAYGHTIQYAHSLAARQELITDRNGGLRVLNYDARGNVVSETDPENRTTTRTFDLRNNRLTETDPNNHTTTWTYDASDNVTSTTDPEDNVTSQTYNARRQILTSTDARNKTTTNVYDVKGNLAQTTDADGKVMTSTYDASGNLLTQSQTVNGVVETTTNTYDAYGNLASETDAHGNVSTNVYDAAGNRTSETRTRTLPGGGLETLTTSYVYDKNGRLVKVTDPDGTYTETVYDAAGRQSATQDKLGRTTSYEYDLMGRLVKTTYPDSSFEESTYDPEGRRLTSKDRAGRSTSYEYDATGRMTRTTFPDATFTENVYDAAGRLTSTKDARGKVTSYEYDSAGRRTRVTDPLSHSTEFTYDGNGNQVTVKDALSRVTTYEYDNLNRRTKTVFPDASFTQTTYDEAGRRTSERDQAGKVTQFRYDKLGRLVKVIDALSQETTYTYDELGNRLTQKDANNHITSFEYDKLGREVARILPDGAREAKTYDALGNLATRTDFLGRVTTYGYDLNNRVTSRAVACSSCEKADASWTYTLTGRRATATYLLGGVSVTEVYGYDNRDRLISKTMPGGALSYTYDANSSRATMTSTVRGTTTVANYAYDDASRLDTVTDTLGRVYDLGYDAVGNRTSLSHPNGVTTTYAYNTLNRLTNLSTGLGATPIQSYAFTLGPSGNRTQIVEMGKTKVYTYDDLYRLTGEQVVGGTAYTKTFGYDPVGNRQTQTTVGSAGSVVTPGVVHYGYDTRDRLLAENATTYGYDANGNLTTQSGFGTYTFDTENRLVRIAKFDGTLLEHAYDTDGVRIRTKTTPPASPTQTTNFLVDTSGGLSHVVAESGATGVQSAYYLRALDDLLAVIRPTGTRHFHADGIGSIRKLTDETGAVTDSYEYTAFGEQYDHVGTDPQPYSFAGEPLEPNTGFQYHRARWMQPSTGRFAGMDPWRGNLFDLPSLHRYSYAGGNSPNATDPLGLFTEKFGRAVEQRVQEIYRSTHAADRTTFGDRLTRIFDRASGTWDRWDIKPDIVNFHRRTYMEIKPLSFSGIGKGIAQMDIYDYVLEPYGYHRGRWQPPITTTTLMGPVGLLEVDGIIFYTDVPGLMKHAKQYYRSLPGLRNLLRLGQAAASGFNEFSRIGRLASMGASASQGRLSSQVSLVTVVSTLSGGLL